MEYLENGINCDTTQVGKRTFSIVSKTHKPHKINTTKAYVYSAVYVLYRWCRTFFTYLCHSQSNSTEYSVRQYRVSFLTCCLYPRIL